MSKWITGTSYFLLYRVSYGQIHLKIKRKAVRLLCIGVGGVLIKNKKNICDVVLGR